MHGVERADGRLKAEGKLAKFVFRYPPACLDESVRAGHLDLRCHCKLCKEQCRGINAAFAVRRNPTP
jgi:hypothetical protein